MDTRGWMRGGAVRGPVDAIDLSLAAGCRKLRRLGANLAPRNWASQARDRAPSHVPGHSTVTLLARLRGLSTSVPRATAV